MENATKRPLLGEEGRQYLREALRKNDPKRVIKEFQENNGLDDASLNPTDSSQSSHKPILPLLDLHGLSRSDIYSGLFGTLKEKLIGVISTMSQETLVQLLDDSFQYIHLPEIQPIVLEVLHNTTEVPVACLNTLAENPELFKVCTIVVKRKVWSHKKTLFREYIIPLMEAYVFDEELELSMRECISVDPPKPRREHASVQKLVEYIGNSIKLYNEFLKLLRLYYVNSGLSLLCALRADILMALHESDVTEIFKVDPCHKLAWCLDACIRQNSMAPRLVKEIKAFFDTLEEMKIPSAYGDIAMIVADPLSFHMLTASILAAMHAQQQTPQDEELEDRLQWMIRLMGLGLGARTMITSQRFKIPKPNPDLSKRFTPALVECFRRDESRANQTKKLLKAAENTAIAAANAAGLAVPTAPIVLPDSELPQPQKFESFISEIVAADELARRIFFKYVLERVIAKDHLLVKAALALLRRSSITIEEDFIQSLATASIQAQMWTIILDEFLVRLAEKSSVAHRHSIRLLAEISSKLSQASLVELATKLAERGQRDSLASLAKPYRQLLTKAGTKLTTKNAAVVHDLCRDAEAELKAAQPRTFGAFANTASSSSSSTSSEDRKRKLEDADTAE